ncbi:MAG: nitrite reductase small subunit NirD [Piscirickettsiaceae bacterium]|nr:nitrite reductase small subunit NirD [Piscirickettsiaceae bacterium]
MNPNSNTWLDVCSVDDLVANSGVCALVEGTQVALFYMPEDKAIYAINNYDPFSLINILSRGLIGDIQGEPMVSSPIYKQHFSLRTGVCFEDETVNVDSYGVRIQAGRVEVDTHTITPKGTA